MDATVAPACPVEINTFDLVQPNGMNRIHGEANATCVLDPCLSGVIKTARGEAAEWVREGANASLQS